MVVKKEEENVVVDWCHLLPIAKLLHPLDHYLSTAYAILILHLFCLINNALVHFFSPCAVASPGDP